MKWFRKKAKKPIQIRSVIGLALSLIIIKMLLPDGEEAKEIFDRWQFNNPKAINISRLFEGVN